MPEYTNRQLYRSLEGLSTKSSSSAITKNTYLINKSRTYKFFYKEPDTTASASEEHMAVGIVAPKGNRRALYALHLSLLSQRLKAH